MNDFTMLPTAAAEREEFLSQLRYRRLEALLFVYGLDHIGIALQHRLVTTEAARSMLNEMLQPRDEGAGT